MITQLQPIAVRLHRSPRTAFPPCWTGSRAGTAAAGGGVRPRAAAPAGERARCSRSTTRSIRPPARCKLKAQFPNDDDRLFPNQFVNARLLLDVQRGATVVPAAAIQRAPRGAFVYVVTPEQTVATVAAGRRVGVDRGDDGRRSTAGADAPGEQVVVDGADRLRDGAPRSRSRDRGGVVNLSRPFILRPVATTLLMVAILLAGALAYRLLPVSALPAGGLPDHPGRDLLSGREPRRDGLVGDRAARAPVRPDARAEPDDVDELERQLGDHAAVRPRPQARRRRAGGAGGDQRGAHAAAARPADPARLQQGQPGRRADPDAGADLDHAAAAAGRGPGRHAAGAEDRRSCRASAW